jgi:hypothetical protein
MKLGSPVKASLSSEGLEGAAVGSDAGAFRGLSSGKGSPPVVQKREDTQFGR